MAALSIRWKLTLWYGAILGCVLSIFSAAVYWTMRHQLLERIDKGLNEELSDVRLEVERASDSREMLQWLDRRFGNHEGFDFQISRSDGKRVFANVRMEGKTLPWPLGSEQENRIVFESVPLGKDGTWRVISVMVPGPEGTLMVQVGRSLEDFEHESLELLMVFFMTAPLAVIITLGGGYFLAKRTLSPVQRMNYAALRISAQNLDNRLDIGNPSDELGQLAATLNRMLDRLETSFVEMQRFTSDAAHELRTPLAVIRSEAEVALRQPRSPIEYQKILGNLLEETVVLSQMADQLLFLSRNDAGLYPSTRNNVEISRLLEVVVANMSGVAREKGVQLEFSEKKPCLVQADETQLRRVFYNIIDNGLKYTKPDGLVSIKMDLEGRYVSVNVSDTGIGISAEHLPRIFDRFFRADPSRTGETGGVGLGLSICQSIVKGLGGTLSATSLESIGSTFRVRLPINPLNANGSGFPPTHDFSSIPIR